MFFGAFGNTVSSKFPFCHTPRYVVDETGYTSTLTGTLMMAEATTSLPYRELLKAETLEFRVAMHYPMFWNDHQEWIFSFVATKV